METTLLAFSNRSGQGRFYSASKRPNGTTGAYLGHFKTAANERLKLLDILITDKRL